MIDYSIAKRQPSPLATDQTEKYYAKAQISDVMDLNEFSAHIANHGSVYSRADIYAILILMVDCLKEMLHKLRSVMGQRDGEYRLSDTIELDEGYFTTENPSDDETPLKRGIGSQRKAKVLVMVESEAVDEPKKGKKNRKCGHIKMKVIRDLKSGTFESEASKSIDTKATVIMDNLGSHAGVEKVVSVSERQTVPGKEAPKVLPWVHVAISNAKALMKDMYHGIKEEFLQSYLDEFCYKFNRMYFGDRTFDRLVVAAVAYKPTFKHRPYNSSPLCG